MRRAALRQHVGQIEEFQRTQDIQNDQGDMRPLQKRERNVEKLLQAPRPVDRRGFVQLLRNVQHICIIHKHAVSCPLPDIDKDQAREGGLRSCQPRLAQEVQVQRP